MQSGATHGGSEAVEAVLAAHADGRPSPFELWYAAAPRPLTTDAVLERFFALNGGVEGLRTVTREGRADLYVGQLERTLGRPPVMVPAPSEPELEPEPEPDFEPNPESEPEPGVEARPENIGPAQVEALPLAANDCAEVQSSDIPETAPVLEPGPLLELSEGSPARWPKVAASIGLAAAACVALALIMTPERSAGPAKTPPPPRRPQPPHAAEGTKPAASPSAPVAAARPQPRPAPAKPTAPAVIAAAKPEPPKAPVKPPAPVATKSIRVNMARRRIALYEHGELVRVIERASFGRKGHGTPVLTNASLSQRRERMHRSRLYFGAPMPYALFLAERPNVAFHAGNVGERSHGCIHLRRQDAKWLFDWVGRDAVRVDITA